MKHQSKKVTRLALSALSAAAFTLFAGHASALGLGRLSVQSALGDALRAEIDVTSLSTEEASSLQVRIASPETYRAAGVDYHPALSGARVTLARRSDGRPYLRLVSERVVTEPFVDLILEMNWASGRLVREYTLLLDPPRNLAQGAAPSAPAQVATPPQSAAAAPNLTASAPAPAMAVATPVPPPAAVAAAPLPPAAPAPADPPPAPAPVSAPAPVATAPAARTATPPAPRTAEQRAAAVRAQRAASAPAAAKAGDVKVKPGDTLSGIARSVQPDGVSLDQLLVTMFRANPDAFAGNNMNRLRAGAILRVPDAEQAQALPAGEARSIIVAQSADFNAYRQRLATSVAKAPSGSSRQAGGRVEASVDDRKQPSTPAPDKLRLSQGAVKASAPEAVISQQAAVKDAKSREAELARNLEDLKKVQGAAVASASGTAAKPPATVTAAAPAAAPAATGGGAATKSGPGVPVPVTAPPVPTPVVPTPAPVVASPPPPAPATMAADAASAAAVAAGASAAAVVAAASTPPMPVPEPASAAAPALAQASGPAVAAAPAKGTPPMAAEAESPGLMDTILESPYVLPGAGALAVLLAGFGFYRVRQQSKKAASETSFMESRLQPDSFFGQSGGQRVDTTDSAAAAAGAVSSSANYSLSQLDAIGDVDPVAEADVYLAYGRDLQAEEILKEAMRSDPNRLAVRTKLLEVYAKRRDVKGFELLATQLFSLTRGEGADWQRAQELGRSIDPENPLYNAGGQPGGSADDSAFSEPLGTSTMPHSVMPAAPFRDSAMRPEPAVMSSDAQDVDIDLSFDAQPATTTARASNAMVDVDVDIDLPLGDPSPASPSGYSLGGQVDVPLDVAPSAPRDIPVDTAARSGIGRADGGLEFDMGDISLDLDTPPKPAPATSRAAPAADITDVRPSGFVDLSGLPDDPDSQFNDDGDPMERKLDLADEFRQIGDLEGARDLLNEVIATADGPLKQKAQNMLDSLG